MEDIRYDLVPPKGLEEVCKVLTSKLEKYNKNEWKFGLKWSDVLSSLKKHLSEFEQGHDYTPEGCLSIAHVAMNALLLCDYYDSYPFGDDRMINKPRKPRIALDIDDTVLDFRNAIQEKFDIKLNDYWDGSYQIKEYLDKLQDDKEFWVNLKPLHKITFEDLIETVCSFYGDNNMRFELDEVETSRAKEFIKEHNHIEEFKKMGKFGFSTLGQQFTYKITPGGLGNSTEIICNHCKEHKSITNIDNW